MLTDNDRKALTEVLAHAKAQGDDEIALDCEAALAGDRNALGYVQLDVKTRADYAAWR